MSKQTDTPENSNFGNNVRIFPNSSGDLGNLEITGTVYTDTLTENTTGTGTLVHNILFNGNVYTLTNTSAPSNPTSGKRVFYLDTADNLLKSKNSSGTITTYNPLTTKGDIPAHNGTTTVRQTIGANNTFLIADSTQNTGLLWTTFVNSGLLRFYYIYSSLNSGTNAGSYTSSGSYITRALNVIETSHGDSNVSLSSNQMTFLAGNYIIRASAPALNVDNFAIRLFNVTDNIPIKSGTAAKSTPASGLFVTASSVIPRSFLTHYLSIGSTKVLTIQFRATTNNSSSNALGEATGFQNEVYTTVDIVRIG